MSKDKENNICDYIAWRGDLSFKNAPFNEVDAMILAQLSYLHLDGIASNNLDENTSLNELAQKFMASPDFETRSKNGPFINSQTVDLLELAAQSERFGNCRICYFTDDLDLKQEKQFSAYTAILDDDTIFVAFRGTHEEIIGWKEDLNMAFETPVPAQLESVKYLENVASHFKNKIIRIGGHSKGGNLALYAAAFCDKKTKKRIEMVYNNDGQGFEKSILESNDYQEILDRIQTVLPHSSMVGILLPHIGKIRIVESANSDLMQHDAFSWQVLGNSFVTVPSRTKQSLYFEKSVQEWLKNLDTDRKKEAVNTLFDVIAVSGANTLTEFHESFIKSSPKILHYIKDVDERTKKDINSFLKIFISSKVVSFIDDKLPWDK
ncbi:MAG: DUF2974 domain-containing protein [Treponemataceae bacterium]|nr:DUF2974 domain-containing protein [Treponemataceae bacterium]